ncbi:MAG: NUDIX hydrolase, partial [Gammaproteobacteria bacterium]
GDHILSGTTTVVSPPDGDMRDYVAQLHRLAGEPFDYILPAHGHVIGAGKREVARLIAHRMAREAKVLDALRQVGTPATVDELVSIAYDDVPAKIHPVARRSLTAHLLKLRDEGVIESEGERWRLP